jgi:hypothetical protein
MEQAVTNNVHVFAEIRRRFIKAKFQAKLARLFRHPQSPLNLDHIIQWMGLQGRCNLGSIPVELRYIVGTRGDCPAFDRAFRPREGKAVQNKWELTGAAILQGVEPPALSIYQWGEAFFVLDREDRVLVSVLKALGQGRIQAQVTGPDKAKIPPPTIRFLEQWEREAQQYRRSRQVDGRN